MKLEKGFCAKLVVTTITVYGIWQQNKKKADENILIPIGLVETTITVYGITTKHKKDGQLCYVWYIILCNMNYKNLEIIDSSF